MSNIVSVLYAWMTLKTAKVRLVGCLATGGITFIRTVSCSGLLNKTHARSVKKKLTSCLLRDKRSNPKDKMTWNYQH